MKNAELREKSVEELNQELKQLQREHFNMRIQKRSEQLARFHLIGQVRKQIARIKTILRERQIGGESA